MSIKHPSAAYIGEKMHKIQLVNHNSVKELSMTPPLRLRSFAVIAFICGLDDNSMLQHSI